MTGGKSCFLIVCKKYCIFRIFSSHLGISQTLEYLRNKHILSQYFINVLSLAYLHVTSVIERLISFINCVSVISVHYGRFVCTKYRFLFPIKRYHNVKYDNVTIGSIKYRCLRVIFQLQMITRSISFSPVRSVEMHESIEISPGTTF